MATDIIHLISF